MVKTKVRAPEPQPVPQPTPQELEIQREQLKLMQKQTAQLDATAPLFKKQLEIMERQLDEMVKNPEIQQEQIELQRDQLELARTSTAYQVKLMEQNLEAQESAGDISKEQLQLQREQIGMARESIAQQESLAPFVLEGMGLVEEPDGSYRRMTEDEFTATLSDTEKAGRENLLLSLERERKALLGELPLSESGQQQKANEFKTFKEAMARAGHVIEGDDPGTAVATTTAGIQSLKAFNERFGLLEEAERRGELTQGSQAVLARAGVASDIGARRTAGLLQFPGASSGVATGSSALALSRTLNPDFRTPADLSTSLLRPDYGRAAGQYAGLLQPYQFSRNLQAQIGRTNLDREFSARQQSAANRAAMWGGLMEAGGTMIGARLGRTG